MNSIPNETLKFAVAGIGTEVGKTVVSAVLVEALRADYWKPVQTGTIQDSDTEMVRNLVSNNVSRFHTEAYRFMEPLSPHAAAALEGAEIQMQTIQLPVTDNHLVVELAGGLLVPLNNQELNIDLVQQLSLPVVLVSRNYLGSINHTLLSVEACRSRHIPVLGLVFNGVSTPATEEFILQYTGIPYIGRINEEKAIIKETISHYARQFTRFANLIGA